jgi:Xaa-Pro aminopeptidase
MSTAYNSTPLKPGMTVSNGSLLSSLLSSRLYAHAEPGYYADGRFGIRIENVVVVREADTPNRFGDKPYLGFENFTMVRPPSLSPPTCAHHAVQCPIQRTLVDKALMAPDEVAWLDAYHAEVWEKVAPLLKNDERATAWLRKECAPL